VLSRLAMRANKSVEPLSMHPGAPPESERSKHPPLPQPPYAPYAEEPAMGELPYKPYSEKPTPHDPPYEPYKGI
jgi:hypothetical protein